MSDIPPVSRLDIGFNSKHICLHWLRYSIRFTILSPWPILTAPDLTDSSTLLFRWSFVSPAWYTFCRFKCAHFLTIWSPTLMYGYIEPYGSSCCTKSMPTVLGHSYEQALSRSSKFFYSLNAFNPKNMKPALKLGCSFTTSKYISSKSCIYFPSSWVLTKFPLSSYSFSWQRSALNYTRS